MSSTLKSELRCEGLPAEVWGSTWCVCGGGGGGYAGIVSHQNAPSKYSKECLHKTKF